MSILPIDQMEVDYVLTLQPTSISKEALRAIGINAADRVLDVLVRYPPYFLTKSVIRETRKSHNGQPAHPITTLKDFNAVAESLALIFWNVRNATNPASVPASERALAHDTHRALRRQSAIRAHLEQPKKNLQRWIFSGVHDHAVAGAEQIRITVEEWRTGLVLRGLSGEERQRLWRRYQRIKTCLI